jgi:1-aminocyclopropane-1-carboxylate deaminase
LWILRDDELGGFWGSKFRKYSSIIRYCREHGINHVIAAGGINSNNLAAAAALCKEADLEVTAFAVSDHSSETNDLTGNRFLIKLLLPPDNLKVVARSEARTIPSLMTDYAKQLQQKGIKSLVLEEGGGCLAAVEGCLTMASDILSYRDLWQPSLTPDHIFIDSGTGLSVASLAAGLWQQGALNRTKIHCIQMAGFDEQIIKAFNAWVTPVTSVTWNQVADRIRVYRPLSPRSYGATNEDLFTFIKTMARNHGLLLDPIYTAKLFLRTFDLIEGQNCRGHIVIIHTGGISGLMGFPQIINEANP